MSMQSEIPAMFCDHANEAPLSCPCSSNCYCKTRTCKNLLSARVQPGKRKKRLMEVRVTIPVTYVYRVKVSGENHEIEWGEVTRDRDMVEMIHGGPTYDVGEIVSKKKVRKRKR